LRRQYTLSPNDSVRGQQTREVSECVYHYAVHSSLQIVRKASFTPRPWKNGGGITHEVIRVPSDGDAFVWRVSVARIDSSGPFSDFAAYNRKMVLLKGDGALLEFADGRQCALRRAGDLAEFDGALATHCTLLGGPCVDLNLMVAKSQDVAVSVQWLPDVPGSLQASASRAESTLIFGIDETLALQTSGEILHLEPWDLAIMSNGNGRVTRLQQPRSAAAGAVFFATISH
jgi:environmental stress-induced protein Ves